MQRCSAERDACACSGKIENTAGDLETVKAEMRSPIAPEGRPGRYRRPMQLTIGSSSSVSQWPRGAPKPRKSEDVAGHCGVLLFGPDSRLPSPCDNTVDSRAQYFVKDIDSSFKWTILRLCILLGCRHGAWGPGLSGGSHRQSHGNA